MSLFTPNPIPFSRISNARDFAGYPTQYGLVKSQKLLRGAHLHRMTIEDQNKLKNVYQVKHIIDLRSSIEVEQYPNLSLIDTHTYHFNVMGDHSSLSANPEEMIKAIMASSDPNNYLSSLYEDFVESKTAQHAYAALFDVLLNEPNYATYWHCTAGKDRTGFASALVLWALGASQNVVMQDFLLSNVYRKLDNIAIMARFQTGDYSEEICAAIHAALTVKQQYLERSCDLINTKYGGINMYLRDVLNMTNEKIMALRAIYLN